jgi:hypothetical protein
MITSYRDPVFGKIYTRKEDKFVNEETGLEIKEGWAIANGFKPVDEIPDPPQIFSSKGEMYVLDGKDINGIPMYKREDTVVRTQKIGYNKALRQGFKTEFTICPHPPSSMELIELIEKQKAKETKVDNLHKAIEGMIRTFTNNYSNVFNYSIRDAQSVLRKALNDLL